VGALHRLNILRCPEQCYTNIDPPENEQENIYYFLCPPLFGEDIDAMSHPAALHDDCEGDYINAE
jgi:hypothetical protein